MEIGQTAPVVGHDTWNVCLLTDAVDALTVNVAACQRLLDIDGLACLHGHDGVGGVGGRRGGNVDGVDVWVADELLCVGVPTGNVVPLCVGTGFILAPAHHGLYAGTRNEVEGRTTFLFGDLTTANEAPTNLPIERPPCPL